MKQKYREGVFPIYKHTKKGSLSVEAAIFLPIFIIGVLTFAYLIKLMAVQETVFHSFADEARKLSSEAVIYPTVPFYEARLMDRLYDENPDDIYAIDLDHFRYLSNASGMNGIISMDLDYKVKIKLPIQFYNDLPISETLVFRGFIGSEEELDPMSFEEMETEKESDLVWIFPKAGGRYHKENCTYISSKPRQVRLSEHLKRKYKSCSICHSSKITNGNYVYCFPDGEVYHKGNCPTVEKYVISIEKEEAIKRGYTPCSKCGGG